MHLAKLRPLAAPAVAAFAGLLWAWSFGREASLWLGWVALVPFLLVLARPSASTRRTVALGVAHGFVTWWIAIGWIPPTIRTFGAIPLPLAYFLFALVSIYLSLFHVAFALAARRIFSRGRLAVLIGLPAVWVVIEWVRGHAMGPLNFPWNLAAYAWVDVPGTLPLAAWIGPWGVSYLVVLANVGLAQAWRERYPAMASVAILGPLLVLALAGRWSLGESLPGEPPLPVRIVQPNQTLRADEAVLRRQYEQIMLQSRSECRGYPALMIWPESAAWPHTWENSWLLRRDLQDLAQRGCDVIINSPTPDDNGAFYNSALLVGPEGPVARYHKRMLVPWGEHVPLGDVFPWIGKLARFAGRFSPGLTPGLMEWQHERLGLAICYEVAFPHAVVDQVREGATVLVNISNDAWYGDSSAPRQLFRAARFRAAENRRPLLRAALTGISGRVDARGEVIERLEIGERDVLRGVVAGRRDLSLYTRMPWLGPLLATILALFAIFRPRRNENHDA